jgi:hypothetical protein
LNGLYCSQPMDFFHANWVSIAHWSSQILVKSCMLDELFQDLQDLRPVGTISQNFGEYWLTLDLLSATVL